MIKYLIGFPLLFMLFSLSGCASAPTTTKNSEETVPQSNVASTMVEVVTTPPAKRSLEDIIITTAKAGDFIKAGGIVYKVLKDFDTNTGIVNAWRGGGLTFDINSDAFDIDTVIKPWQTELYEQAAEDFKNQPSLW